MRRHGQRLLQHAPWETTTLLIDLCCGTLDQVEPDPDAAPAPSSRAPYLSYLSYGAGKAPPPTSTVRAPSVASATAVLPSPTLVDRKSGLQSAPPPAALPERLPSPRDFFAHFIDNPTDFVRFLEVVAECRYGQRLDTTGPPSLPATGPPPEDDAEATQRAIWNTLLELYLSTPDASKALKVLQSRLPYDPTQALVVCTAAEFTEGVVLLYERLDLQEDVVRLWMDRGEGKRVVGSLRRYGPERPELYRVVLRWLTGDAARLEAFGGEVAEVGRLLCGVGLIGLLMAHRL